MADALLERARTLRAAFDRSFQVERVVSDAQRFDFLTIRVASERHALRLPEVLGLYTERRLVPAPSRLPALVGLSAFRGVVTPVYDLGVLLGYRATARATSWLVVARGSAPIGFSFDGFDAHLRAAEADLVAAPAASSSEASAALRVGDGVIPLLDLPRLIESVARAATTALRQEP